MNSFYQIPIPARCFALALALGTSGALAHAPQPAPTPPEAIQHIGLYDRVDPASIPHIQGEPLTPAQRPPQRGDDLYQRIDYSRPVTQAAPKAVCDIAQFADASAATIVSVVQAATVACVNEGFDNTDSALDLAIFTEAKMTAVANALAAASPGYPGNNSTQVTQLIMFLRVGYYATGRTTLGFDTSAFRTAMAGALRAFADNPNLTAPGSAQHGYALRDFLILLRSANVIPEHLDTMTRVLNAYSSADYAPYYDMRGAVNYVFNLTYYLLFVPANHAGVAADDHGFREALRDFVVRNFDADYGNGTTEYLITNSAAELGRYLDIKTPPAFLAETRDLVKSLTDQYSLSHGRNVFLKLAEMITYFDNGNCAWYGTGVCTAMADLMDEILPPAQTRVCNDLRIRNNDLTATQLDYICESLDQQKAAFLQLVGVEADQPVPDDHNTTLEVVIFRNQSHYISYSGTFFGNSTNNGGIYLEGNPANPANIPRFITFIAPSGWVRPVGSGIWEPWNLHHEYTHYLDGRYNFHGGFSALPGTAPYSAVWFTEGFGEYMAQHFLSNLPASNFPVIAEAIALSFLIRNDDNVWYVGTDPSRNVPLSTIFDNQYGVSPQDNIYVWGYLATRFMFERYRSSVDALFALTRVGDYAPGYRTWLDNIRNGKDQEFRTWLDCYLLNDGDTAPCNVDVANRLFSDDFEGDAPPPEPEHIPVNLPLCGSTTTLTNGCKIANLQTSGTNATWISILPPANARTLWIKTRNGMGDVDVYVAKTPTWPYPNTPDADSSTNAGNTEAVGIENPGNVWHNIGLHAKGGEYFSGVDIYAYWLLDGQEDIDPSFGDDEGEPDFDPAALPECDVDPPSSPSIFNGCKRSGITKEFSNHLAYFSIGLPAGSTNLKVGTFGGTGDADLYGKSGGYPAPATDDFDHSSTNEGNVELIQVEAPAPDGYTYYNLAIKPKTSSFEDVTIWATWDTN